MSNKSSVTVEGRKCIICGKDYGTDTLMIHKRMREVFEPLTVTDFGPPCKDCQKNLGEGEDRKIALVGIDLSKSTIHADVERLKQEEAHRTGRISFLVRWAWPQIFNIPDPGTPMVFLEDEAIDQVEKRVRQLTRFLNARGEHMNALPVGINPAGREAAMSAFCDTYEDLGDDPVPIDAKRKESDEEVCP